MTLTKTLQRRPRAAAEFRSWARQLARQWGAAENLCAAHSAALLSNENHAQTIAKRILAALQNVEKTLRCHEKNLDKLFLHDKAGIHKSGK